MEPRADRELVSSYLRDRSEDAFRSLYRAHSSYLFCLALRLSGGRRGEAEDAVQEAWIRAAQRLASFRWRSSLRTWLAGILINCCREQGRRRRPAAGDPHDVHLSVEIPLPVGTLDLERHVAQLPNGQREVLILFHIQGYTHDEIARLLQIAPGTSKSRLFEARRKLRRALTETREAGERR